MSSEVCSVYYLIPPSCYCENLHYSVLQEGQSYQEGRLLLLILALQPKGWSRGSGDFTPEPPGSITATSHRQSVCCTAQCNSLPLYVHNIIPAEKNKTHRHTRTHNGQVFFQSLLLIKAEKQKASKKGQSKKQVTGNRLYKYFSKNLYTYYCSLWFGVSLCPFDNLFNLFKVVHQSPSLTVQCIFWDCYRMRYLFIAPLCRSSVAEILL